MRPKARAAIRVVAEERGLDPVLFIGKHTTRVMKHVYARADVARRLDAAGYSVALIGRVIGRDHATVLYYLGRVARRLAPEPEKKALPPAPAVALHQVAVKPKPKARRSYAGFDPGEQQIKAFRHARA